MTSWPSKSTLQRLLDLAGLHYTTSERSGPFWQSMLHNFLSCPLSFLGWTTAMLFWLDFHQTQSNLYKWFRMQRHDWSSTSPKEPMLHLSSSPCTGYQLQLASSSRHWCLHTERPQAQHPLTSTHYYESPSPPEVWDLQVSDALWYHHREAQNHSPEHSRSPFLAGGIIFPPLSGLLDPCQSSSNNRKLISFGTTWLHPELKKNNNNTVSYSLQFTRFPSFDISSHRLQVTRRAFPVTDVTSLLTAQFLIGCLLPASSSNKQTPLVSHWTNLAPQCGVNTTNAVLTLLRSRVS